MCSRRDNSKARNRICLNQRVLLMSRACSLRHNLMPALLSLLMLVPLKKAALYAVGTLVHAGLSGPGSTATAWSTNAVLWAQELDCSYRASAELELNRKVQGSRWFQNKQTNKQTHTPENRWEKPRWDEHNWDDVEQSRASALLWVFIGWVTRALQKGKGEGSYCLFWGFGKNYCTKSAKLENSGCAFYQSSLKLMSRWMEINFHHSKAELNRKRLWSTLSGFVIQLYHPSAE